MHNHEAAHNTHAGHSPEMFRQKFWVSLLLTIPTLVFSTTVQEWFNLSFSFMGSEYIPAIFGSILFFYGGYVFLKGAVAELRNRQPGMMSLISLAITSAFLYSIVATFGIVDGMDFWWELATLITIMLLGHWLEMRSVMSAESALKELAKLLPDTAERIQGESVKKIPLTEVRTGDVLLVRPGSSIPVDARIKNGESDVNESMLTGESKPVKKEKGMTVIAGTINGSGSLTIIVEKTGENTALAGIMRLVADAQKSASKTQILADKAAFYLTFVALFVATMTATIWTILGARTDFILERIVTVLVIACPHALGLAVPLVTAISTSRGARSGLLVRKRAALEMARNIDVVLFDKTGTLTEGKQGVVDIFGKNSTEILTLAASVERDSEHSLAKAIVASAKAAKITLLPVKSFKALPGRGVQADVDNNTTYIGGPKLLEHLNLSINKSLSNKVKAASRSGKTIVYVIQEKNVFGALALADVIRPQSKEAVSTLKASGVRVALLTGDSEDVAAWVATELGIDEYFANVLPEHKADIVKKLQADGSRVAMVGDGVNDAPALTTATVGIAIGAGTDVAIESAGIILVSSDPASIPKIIALSRATYRKMLQNLIWAAGYNVVMLPLAAGVSFAFGFAVSPALGAVLMSVSTIIVALNAQLLRKEKI